MIDFEQHLMRQIAWSRATFGPGTRQEGVSDHIHKELVEVANAPTHSERVNEWTDVVILALDGLWRELAYGAGLTLPTSIVAEYIVNSILNKHDKNELRDWPDWRTADPNKAIEHDRTGEV